MKERERNVVTKLRSMKKQEINRLKEEFFHRDYERRYKVSLLHMLNIIVGEFQCYIEYTNIERDLKVYL